MQSREIEIGIQPQMSPLRQRERTPRLTVAALRRRGINTSTHSRDRHRQSMIDHSLFEIFKRDQPTNQRQRRSRDPPPRLRTRPRTRPIHPRIRRHVLHRATPVRLPDTAFTQQLMKFPQPIPTRLPQHKTAIMTNSRHSRGRQRNSTPRRRQRSIHRTIEPDRHSRLTRGHRINRNAVRSRIDPRTITSPLLHRDLFIKSTHHRNRTRIQRHTTTQRLIPKTRRRKKTKRNGRLRRVSAANALATCRCVTGWRSSGGPATTSQRAGDADERQNRAERSG